MSEQKSVPRPPSGQWIGFTLILIVGSPFMFGVLSDSRNWPSTWPAQALVVSILAIVFVSLIHIEVTLVNSAINTHEARRTRSPKPDEPRRLRGWLLVYAALAFPMAPVYIAVTKQKSDGTTVIGWLVFALLIVGVWVALQIHHLVRYDPDAFDRALHNRRVQRVGVVSTFFVAFFGGYAIFTPAVFAQEATVVRVIDGDTVDVRVEAGVRRIRVLNVDTPESVDPTKPVECLSEEATEFSESLLAKGQTVKLVYDKDRKDRYGRTLAHIELGDGRMLSTELAKAGLGVPMVVGRNDARIDEIRDAFESAAQEHHGFFDPSQKCTFAARSAKANQAAATALTIDSGTSAADALAAATTLAAVANTYADLRDEIRSKSSFPIRAFLASSRSDVVGTVAASLQSVKDRETKMHSVATNRDAKQKARKAAEQKAAAEEHRKAVEARRNAAEQKTVAEERRKAIVKRQRQVPPRRQAATTPKPKTPKESGGNKTGGKSSSDSKYPGYTGPRCYAPGGRTWHPC